MKNNDCGVFYVAAGQKYVDEACNSAVSLKQINSALKISIACNIKPSQQELFDQIILVNEIVACRNEGLLFKTKYLYRLSPYQKTLFVDTDTFFVNDIESGFSILDYFDVSMTLDPPDTYYPSLPSGERIDCKPVNTGVIFFKKNEVNDYFFQEWLKIYSEKLAKNPQIRESDQTSCTQALMYSQTRFYPLSTEWNTRFCFINTLQEPAKILHAYSGNIKKLLDSLTKMLTN
ncbi:MAG: hypothetical protein EA365_03500 [Gloeocapsa sp. DLM2.Bin57]|nr:MAG: hypothetical protein EA365_03500 [Gloeocapsa sp. DLM2.Bin57]